MDNYESLVFVNGSGETVELSTPETTKWWELRGRSGFTAPEIEIISQKYANGVTKILKRLLTPRAVTVNMVITGDTTQERDASFFGMISKLMDIDGGNTGKLYARRSDGLEVYLNCAYSSGLSIVEEYRKLHRFTLEFYAPDPYFYRDLPDAAININPGSYLTLSDTLLFGNYHKIGEITSFGSGVIDNDSGESIQPVIRLQKAVGTLTITNEDSGYSIIISGISMTSGQTLVIDTRDDSKNIYIENPDGTTVQAGQYLEWSNTNYEFPILPGQNHISYDGSAGSAIESLTFSMSERFLSA